MKNLNHATNAFIHNLQQQEGILGIVLFGSWARGNQRVGSDVDLLVIVADGYKRSVERLDRQVFEIIYVTAQGAKDYYKTDLDATHRFWTIAKILFDRDGVVADLQQYARELTRADKQPLSDSTIEHFAFDAQDQIDYAIDTHSSGDIATANLVLTTKITALTEIYFDTIQEWRPAPKQIIAEIRRRDAPLAEHFTQFYSDNTSFTDKVALARNIVDAIFANN